MKFQGQISNMHILGSSHIHRSAYKDMTISMGFLFVHHSCFIIMFRAHLGSSHLANLVLDHNGLARLNDEPARSDKDLVLERAKPFVASLEDVMGDYYHRSLAKHAPPSLKFKNNPFPPPLQPKAPKAPIIRSVAPTALRPRHHITQRKKRSHSQASPNPVVAISGSPRNTLPAGPAIETVPV